LYQIQNTTPVLFDGVFNMYDDTYADQLDEMDVKKLTNTGENLSIVTNDKQLSMESRSGITPNDTIFYNLSNMKLASYQLSILPEQLDQSGLQAILEDKYLQSRTAIDMANGTQYNFNVTNDPGSYSASRFRLVFNSSVAPSAISINVKSETKENEIIVNWDVEYASNINRYAVERSADGNRFDAISEQPATVLSQYVWIDQRPAVGFNYYRIKATDKNGRTIYSNITKSVYNPATSVTVYPNPIKADRLLKVKVENALSGDFTLNIIDLTGKMFSSKTINHPGGVQTYTMQIDNKMAKGIYTIEVIDTSNYKTSIKVQY
jgi:hypothetical protein